MTNKPEHELTAEDFKSALLASRGSITTQQHAMLKAHWLAENHTITAAQLAAAAGYPNYESANLYYGRLGKTLAPRLPLEPEKRKGGARIWTTILATGDASQPQGAHFQWVMRPELVEALRVLPWFKKPSGSPPSRE